MSGYNAYGLVGYDGGGNNIINCFWDIETSGKTEGGIPGATGKTTAEMKTRSTFTSADWWLEGNTDNVLGFDGVDDYVNVPGYYGIGGTSARTTSLWVKTATSGKTQYLLRWGSYSTGQFWGIYLRADAKVGVSVYNGGVYSTATVIDGQWHHIAAVLDEGQTNSSQIRLYIDGVLDATATGSCTINTGQTLPVYMGVLYDPSPGVVSYYFEGLMDDVCIYSRALDANEIVPANPIPTDGLVAHWAMDETEGTVAHDSVSSYDGVLENMSFIKGVWAICEGTNYPRLMWQIPAGDWACPDGVNVEDLDYFVGRWLLIDCTADNDYCGGADMDSSGVVDMADLAMFAQHWLEGI
jgi:hypothetical protein